MPGGTDEGTILIVEDEENIRFSLAAGLKREGYRVLTAIQGEEALELLSQHRVDLVLLDLMLPGMSGLDVCRLIRRDCEVPIIMVTARDAETDVIVGLEMGADDYVTKPFSLNVLLARIRANMRRTAVQQVPEHEVLQVGSVRLDSESYRVMAGSVPLDLTPRLFDLLLFMAQQLGKVCSRDQLLNAVWGYDYVGETRTVDVHIHWLREKIQERAPDLQLETVRGVGYRLVVQECSGRQHPGCEQL
ncbi:MAG: response regulator transcription factor [Bacillota bacterium]